MKYRFQIIALVHLTCTLIIAVGGAWPRAGRVGTGAAPRASTKAMRPTLDENKEGYLSKFLSLFNPSRWPSFRRQDREKLFRTTTTVRDNYREPYWTNGHWVFDRYNYTTTTEISNETTTTEMTTEGSTKCGAKTSVMTTTEPTTTTDIWDFYKYNTNATHKQCNMICPRIYLQYGTICAMRIEPKLAIPSTWTYVYQTFDNICALERENCMNHTSRWKLRHSGPCVDIAPKDSRKPWYEKYAERFTHFPTDHSSLASRAASFGNFNYSFMDTQLPWLGRLGQIKTSGWYHFWYCTLGNNWLMC